MLLTDFSHRLLSTEAILQAYAEAAADGRRPPFLDQVEARVLGAVTESAPVNAGRALHQVTLARRRFEAVREERAPDSPLVVTALGTLAEELLVYHRGELMFRPEGHLRWRERWSGSTLVEPLRAAAAALSCLRGEPEGRWMVRATPRREVEVVSELAPLLPPVADDIVLQLRREGLVEVHRHDSLSKLPDQVWLSLLYGAAPDLGGSTHLRGLDRWVRQARALTRALDAVLGAASGDECLLPDSGAVTAALLALTPRSVASSEVDTPLPLPWVSEDEPTDPLARMDRCAREDRRRLARAIRALVGGQARRDLGWILGWVFHAWLVCRHLIEGSLLHPPQGARGLDRFRDQYVLHPWQSGIDVPPGSRARQAWRDGAVRMLEVKVGPGWGGVGAKAEQWRELLHGDLSWVERVLSGGASDTREEARLATPDPEHQRPGISLVLHFLREPDIGPPPPNVPLRRPRWADLRAKVGQQCRELRAFIDGHPLGALYVGIDIASFELDAPAEVFAAAFRTLRAPWALSRGDLAGATGAPAVRSLGASVHAGEEFHHLLAGMRQVDEHLRFLELRAGDRLGHALALGLEPTWWREEMGGEVTQPRLGRLDDLVWLYHHLTRVPEHSHLCHGLREEMAEHCRRIYGRDVPPGVLHEAWTLRCVEPEVAPAIGGRGSAADDAGGAPPSVSPDPLVAPEARWGRQRARRASSEALDVWQRYLYGRAARIEGDAPITVRLRREDDDAIRFLQDQMLRRLETEEIAIEANPSSNLAIAQLGRVARHPIFRWFPVRSADRAGRPLPTVCVGSDDPAIFHTELLHEYALLIQAAREEGHAPREVRTWVEELRRNADRALFRVAGSPVGP